MVWTVEVTEQFEQWWDALSEDETVSIDGMIRVLESHGPTLAPPFSAVGGGSCYPELRELRVPHGADAICVLYVSDPTRAAIVLLIGAVLADEDAPCPPDLVQQADRIYSSYLSRRENPH